jgi:hypothetical protein
MQSGKGLVVNYDRRSTTSNGASIAGSELDLSGSIFLDIGHHTRRRGGICKTIIGPGLKHELPPRHEML